MHDPADLLRSSYDRVAAAYAKNLYGELAGKPLDRHLLNRFAEEVLNRGMVADIGCGPGHVARYLHERGVRVCGVDLSPEMVRWATQLNPGIDFRVDDMRALKLSDGELIGIVGFYAIIHLEGADFGTALREFRRVLVANGLLLLSFHVGTQTVHREEMWGQQVSLDFHFLMPADVKLALEAAGFKVIESVERESYEGAEYASRRCYLLAKAV
jgi:SAM-dependent methyltransferase